VRPGFRGVSIPQTVAECVALFSLVVPEAQRPTTADVKISVRKCFSRILGDVMECDADVRKVVNRIAAGSTIAGNKWQARCTRAQRLCVLLLSVYVCHELTHAPLRAFSSQIHLTTRKGAAVPDWMPAAVRARAKLRKHSLANADAILANGGRLLDDDELAADLAGPVPSDDEEDEESSEQEEEEAPAGRRGGGGRGAAAKPSAAAKRGGGGGGGSKAEDDSDDSAFMPADFSREGGGVDAAVKAILQRQEDAACPLAAKGTKGKPAAQHSSGKPLKLVPPAKAKAAAKAPKAAPAAAKRAAPASAPASPRAAKKPKASHAHAHALHLPSLEDTLAAALAEEPFFELVAHAVKENALNPAESFAFMGTLSHADAKEQARAMRLRMRMRLRFHMRVFPDIHRVCCGCSAAWCACRLLPRRAARARAWRRASARCASSSSSTAARRRAPAAAAAAAAATRRMRWRRPRQPWRPQRKTMTRRRRRTRWRRLTRASTCRRERRKKAMMHACARARIHPPHPRAPRTLTLRRAER
jgi:hypothetical protein